MNAGISADVTDFTEGKLTNFAFNHCAVHNSFIAFKVGSIIDQGHESESCSSSVGSTIEEDRVALKINELLKRFLELDHDMISKQEKLVVLPAKVPVVTILENFVKYQSIKTICGPHPADQVRRRNSAAKPEKREKDYEKLKTR